MPDQSDYYRRPEQLLAGSDRPRPLSPALRSRLEGALAGLAGRAVPVAADTAATNPPAVGDGTAASRPLSPEVRRRLENSLRRRDGPGGPTGPGRPARSWRQVAPAAGLAAAVVVIAAVAIPQLVRHPGTPPGKFSAERAVRPGAHPRLPPSANGIPAGRSTKPAVTTPHAPAPGSPAPTSTVPVPAVSTVPTRGQGPMAAVAAALAVTSVTPDHGPVVGGTWVVVAGQGFAGTSAVRFGAAPAVAWHVLSGGQLRAEAPAHAAGTVDVEVTGLGGRSRPSAADHYTFGP